MSHRSTIPIYGVAASGAVALIAAVLQWQNADPAVFAAYAAALTVAAAVRPAWSAFSFLLTLAGCAAFSPAEVLVAAAAAAGVASASHRMAAAEAALSAGARVLTAAACYFAFHLTNSLPASIALATFTYLTVSAALEAAGGESLGETFQRMLSGPFVSHLLAAAGVGVALTSGWMQSAESWLVIAPLAYMAHFFHGLWGRAIASDDAASAADQLPARVKAYVAVIAAIAGLLLVGAILRWDSVDAVRFAAFLAASIVVSAWKIRLPKLDSAISPGFVMVLVAIAELGAGEVILIAMASVVAQSYWRPARTPKPVQVVFNASCLAIASAAAFALCRVVTPGLLSTSLPLFFVLAWAVLYGGNSFMVARILSLLQSRPVMQVWRECYFWSLPYFLVGAAAAALISSVSRSEGWLVAMYMLPLMALVSFSYKLQVSAAAARR